MDLNPLPNQPINFKYPFAYSTKGAFATNDTTVAAIADDLKILIKTNWGERVIHYDFGANLRALLFNPTTNISQQIQDAISAAVEKWMPGVVIDDMTVKLYEDDPTIEYNRADIKIHFSIGNTGLGGDLSVTV